MGSTELSLLTCKKKGGVAPANKGKVQCDHVLKQATITTNMSLI